MVNTNFAVGGAAYTQQSRSSSANTPQAAVSQDGYAGAAREESVSPQVAYADTASPSLHPANMETDFLTLVAAGVCALVVFSCCCAGNQNGNRG